MHTTTLTASVLLIGALLSSGIVLAQPASMRDAVEPVDTGQDAADAAASGLDEFDADEGFKDVNFGGALSYRFRWSVVALGTYARLLGDANQFFGDALINLSILRVGPRCKLLAHDEEAGQPQ